MLKPFNEGRALEKSLYVFYGISLQSNSITTLIAEVFFKKRKHKSEDSTGNREELG